MQTMHPPPHGFAAVTCLDAIYMFMYTYLHNYIHTARRSNILPLLRGGYMNGCPCKITLMRNRRTIDVCLIQTSAALLLASEKASMMLDQLQKDVSVRP